MTSAGRRITSGSRTAVLRAAAAAPAAAAVSLESLERRVLLSAAVAPMVKATAPAGVQTAPVSQVDITFSEAMNPSSFSVSDDVASLKGPGNADLLSSITGSTWVSSTTLRITFVPTTADGEYTLVIGPNITAADDGSAMDQDQDGTAGEETQDRYAATFRYDSLLLNVSSAAPVNGSMVTLPFAQLTLNFNEPLDPASAGVTDVTLSRGTVTGFTVVDSDTVRYFLGGITGEAGLTVNVAAGALTDLAGNPGAAYAGSYSLDTITEAFPSPLATKAPAGSGVYAGAITTNLSAGDVDSYTLELDAGQTLTAIVDPAPSLRAKVEVFSPLGVLLGSASPPATGKDAFVQAVAVASAGRYTVRLTSLSGTTGTARVEVNLNAATEAEAHDGPDGSFPSSAQSLAAAFRAVGAAGQEGAAVVGTFTASSDPDCYMVSLAAGDSLTAYVTDATGVDLSLTTVSGVVSTLHARGNTNATFPSVIADFVAPAAGNYYINLMGTPAAGVPYTLVVLRNAGAETFSNNLISSATRVYATPVGGKRAYAGYLDGGDLDVYRVDGVAGTPVTVSTSTPWDGPNLPANLLDPKVELLGPSGVVLASDDNSAADGRNADLSYTPTTSGPLYVRVSQSAAAPAQVGEYTVRIGGALAAGIPFTATAISPSGGVVTATPTSVAVTFSDAVNLATISASDLTLDGVPATSVQILDYYRAQFKLAANTSAGPHTLAIAAGAVSDVHGNPVAAASATVEVDNVAPRVTASTLQQNDIRPAGDLSVTLRFDEPLRASALDLYDAKLYGSTRDVTLYPFALTPSADYTTVTLTFVNVKEDHYKLTLSSGLGGYCDVAGNALDGEALAFPIGPNKSGNGAPGGDFVVPFDVDAQTTAFPTSLVRLAPQGASLYSGSANGIANAAGDFDSFTIQLDGGQTLSAVVDPASALGVTVSVFDPDGMLLATSAPVATGKDAVVQAVPIVSSGTYVVTVTGLGDAVGSYRLDLIANGVSELEPHDGGPNDSPDTAEDLDETFSAALQDWQPDRTAVVGLLDGGGDTDCYSFTLAAGDSVTLLVGSKSGSLPGFKLYDPAGNAVAYSRYPISSFATEIRGFVAGAAGRYSVRLSWTGSSLAYQMLVLRNGSVELESNATIAEAPDLQAPQIAGEQLYVGQFASLDTDVYRVRVRAGGEIRLETFTPGDGAYQPVTLPNPRLRLMTAGGVVLASDDNSAADGRNAVLSYIPAADATLYVEVTTTGGPGDYVLLVNGAVTTLPPFTGKLVAPADGAQLLVAPTTFTIDFDDAVDLSTLSAGDLTVDGVAASTFTVVDYHTVRFTAAATPGQGAHTVAVAAGAVSDLQGTPVAAVASAFTVDATAPKVLAAERRRTSDPTTGGAQYIRLAFSEDVKQSLTAADLSVRSTANAGGPVPVTVEWDPTGVHTALVRLPAGTLADGDYLLTLSAAGVSDLAGNPLDGDNDGTAGGDFTFKFFQLGGDVNGDRSVTFDDLVVVAQHYNTGTGMTWDLGDVTGDAAVDFQDLVVLAQRYNTGLGVPTAGVMTAAATSSGDSRVTFRPPSIVGRRAFGVAEDAMAPVAASQVIRSPAVASPTFSVKRVPGRREQADLFA